MKKKLFIFSFILFFILIPNSFLHASGLKKILIVPGHDNEVWGSQYGNIKEADMNLVLATRLFNLLKKDKRFKVYITRNSVGYTKEFADFFSNNRADIFSFIENSKKEMQSKIVSGSFVTKVNAPHNAVSEDVALRLYGFNKWANENEINAVIHIHFNDYPRPSKWTMGKYKGFAIYIPDEQFINSEESTKLAKSIFSKLNSKYITSTYINEEGGLIYDQKLIALGVRGTLAQSVNSVLVEYGYIYRFSNNSMRHSAYTKMAKLTALGIENYFFNPQTLKKN